MDGPGKGLSPECRTGHSWIYRVLDPAIEARNAQVDRLPAGDLAIQLLLVEALRPKDQALDLGPDIQVEVLIGDDRRLGVGDGIDPDEVVIAPARMDLPLAARTE